MWLRLRQICLVAHDIERVTEQLRSVFGLEVCYIDENVGKYGLENRLLPIGNQLLEIVAPTQAGTAAGRYLDRRGGDGGYMVITQCDDHAPRKARIAEMNVRVANAIEHDGFHGMQLHPKDTGGAFFEIDVQDGGEAVDGPWAPAGPDWKNFVRTDVIDAITAAELQTPDPKTLATRWSQIADAELQHHGGTHSFSFENATARFVPDQDGRGEGLGGIDVRAVDKARALTAAAAADCPVTQDTIHIGGFRFNLV